MQITIMCCINRCDLYLMFEVFVIIGFAFPHSCNVYVVTTLKAHRLSVFYWMLKWLLC